MSEHHALLSRVAKAQAESYTADVATVIEELRRVVRFLSGASVYAFGSAVNGFGDETSDIDLVLEVSPAVMEEWLGPSRGRLKLDPRVLGALQGRLQREGWVVQEKVLHAKVPILKLSFRGFDCDLSCNNLLPVFNTYLLKSYADINPHVVALVLAVKGWAKREGIHGAYLGHLSSYAFTLMAIFYMQACGALPCIQEMASEPQWYQEGSERFNVAMGCIPPGWRPSADADFQGFVRFFDGQFAWGEAVVSVRKGQLGNIDNYPLLKRKLRSSIEPAEACTMLHIEDPFNLARNLNCVLSPGHNSQLKAAFALAAQDCPSPPGHAEAFEVAAEPSAPKRVWRPASKAFGFALPEHAEGEMQSQVSASAAEDLGSGQASASAPKEPGWQWSWRGSDGWGGRGWSWRDDDADAAAPRVEGEGGGGGPAGAAVAAALPAQCPSGQDVQRRWSSRRSAQQWQ